MRICHHITAPTDSLHLTTATENNRRLLSADVPTLSVLATRHSNLGDRTFPVAAAHAWNSLPSATQLAPSLNVFRRQLKTFLFRSSFH
jgi:hypothetical protein